MKPLRFVLVPVLLTLTGISAGLHAQAQDVAQLNRNNKSITWSDAIEAYRKLDARYSSAQLLDAGLTDCGKPLHVFAIAADGKFDPAQAHRDHKVVVLILNGIHPGEPDGIDASLRFATELLTANRIPSNVLIGIVPVYNVDGALIRGCCSRANQNGPEAYGFRGNSRNLDLNRDFIKCDSENARSFTRLFRSWDPDVFLDTHVSDGADYPYVMTLIATQHNKLGEPAGTFLDQQFTPALYQAMNAAGAPMIPYVNSVRYDDDPSLGYYAFMESPRFATGYTALYQTFGFIAETHMLKPFADRVEATLSLIRALISFSSKRSAEIIDVRRKTREAEQANPVGRFNFRGDSLRSEPLRFRGYTAVKRTSEVTGLEQLFYDHSQPYEKEIPYYKYGAAGDSAVRPVFYVVPQAWHEVIERLQLNQVLMVRIKTDTLIQVNAYYITNYNTGSQPYEGHYLHRGVTTREETVTVQLFAGDYIIPARQEAARYLTETLEPRGEDSFFAWGFFDSVLQQKEWYSAYVFDPQAAELLKNPDIRTQFEARKQADPSFAADRFAQLNFLYRLSGHMEPSVNRYPVYRLNVTPVR